MASKKYSSKLNAKTKKMILVGSILVIAIIVIARRSESASTQTETSIEVEEVQAAISTTEINEEIFLPTNDDPEDPQEIRYVIESAEKRKEILVQGQKATAVEGRIFLILNVKIVNDIDAGLEIKTRDYVRLAVNGDTSEWYAPTIHNDPVEVQAISTRLSRLGFPIDETDANLVLQLGEIAGEKKFIDINFN